MTVFVPTGSSGEAVWVLGNPSAGRGRAGKLAARIEKFVKRWGIRASFFWPESAEALRRQASDAAAAGCHRLLVVGGDGTVLEAINGMVGSGVELGVIPAGDANDLAAALKLPRDPEAAIELALGGGARELDLVQVRFSDGLTRVYAGAGGAGLDAEAARLASSRFRRLPHTWRYLAGALMGYHGFQPFELQAYLDEQTYRGPALLAAVANSPAYGGGIRIAPAARMDDGWLEIVILGDPGWMKAMAAAASVARSGDLGGLGAVRFRSRHARLETERTIRFHGDGELLGSTPLDCHLLPGALRVICSARGAAEAAEADFAWGRRRG